MRFNVSPLSHLAFISFAPQISISKTLTGISNAHRWRWVISSYYGAEIAAAASHVTSRRRVVSMESNHCSLRLSMRTSSLQYLPPSVSSRSVAISGEIQNPAPEILRRPSEDRVPFPRSTWPASRFPMGQILQGTMIIHSFPSESENHWSFLVVIFGRVEMRGTFQSMFIQHLVSYSMKAPLDHTSSTIASWRIASRLAFFLI